MALNKTQVEISKDVIAGLGARARYETRARRRFFPEARAGARTREARELCAFYSWERGARALILEIVNFRILSQQEFKNSFMSCLT